MFQLLFGPRIKKYTYKRKDSNDEISENWQQCPGEYFFSFMWVGKGKGHCIYYLYFV